MGKVKVIINSNKHIPGLGKGPFTEPIFIDDNHYHNLKAIEDGAGFLVLKVEDGDLNDPLELKKGEEVKETEEVVEEETAKEEVVEEESVEETTEEPVKDTEVAEEETTEEVVEEESDEEVKEESEVDFSEMTVKEIKKELDELGVEYKYDAKKAELIEVLEAELDK